MKPSSPRPASRHVSRSDARKSLIVNQFATPGLGSMMGGRFIAGTGQLILALAGFVLVTGWFVMKMVELYDQIGGNSQPKPYGWIGKWGAIIFAAAWLWSWVTSLSLLIEAKKSEEQVAKNPPPRIDEVPGE